MAIAPQDVGSQDAASQDAASQDAASQHTASQNTAPQDVTIPAKSGTIAGVAFGPVGEAHGTLIVLHDIYGLDEATRGAAARLASLGYAVVAPDLFTSQGAPPDTSSEAALLDYTSALFDTRVVDDVLAAVAYAGGGDPSTRIGIVGWGWGGAYALMAAAYDSSILAALNIGGAITYPTLTANRPGSPLNFVANIGGALFAAFPGGDPQFPEIEVERMGGRIVEHDKRGEIKFYPDAPPRFWRDDSLPQTQALWRRIANFIDEYVREGEVEPGDEASLRSPQGIPDSGYPNEQSRLHA
jgi:carboxymethylenebutenolidase